MSRGEMTAPYAVPKREVQAEVVLPRGPRLAVRIFLSERAESHSGFERPGDLLNGADGFIPAMDDRGELVLLNRDSVVLVSVAAEEEFGGEEPRAEDLAKDEATRALVEVLLEDGTTLRGLLTYLLPESHRRLQDFLNMDERFLALHDADLARLINKRRIARVTPI